ncbi:MAG: polyketide synthase, partial [Chromatocurvus sp.]
MEKIAVIGLSTLFPGAGSPAEFWQNLLDKTDSRSLADAQQMGVDPAAYMGRKGEVDKYYCISGGYIRDFHPDTEGLSLPPDALSQLDDLYQWSLHVARAALVDAGYFNRPELLRDCGLILANLSFPTKHSNHSFLPLYHRTVEATLRRLLDAPGFSLSPFSPAVPTADEDGLISGYPAALIARALGLGASFFALDAACASSCYAVKLACDYLRAGKAEMMLAGAVSAADPWFVNMGFSIFQAYPANGISAPLDKNSQGLFASEGAGMLVLKRYRDAVRDGDPVYALIRGGALSNDGKGEFVLSPSSRGQVLAYERAYADADLAPAMVDYVECHATGTPKGDRVELNSMETFFSRHQAHPRLGSAKSNLGHMLTAAGMPSMTKVMLGMNAGLIPPTLNLQQPNSSATGYFSSADMPADSLPWPVREDAGPRYAGVSVFGFGGSNAHMVFEQMRGQPAQPAQPTPALPAMAIVGMDAHFGGFDRLAAVRDALFAGTHAF